MLFEVHTSVDKNLHFRASLYIPLCTCTCIRECIGEGIGGGMWGGYRGGHREGSGGRVGCDVGAGFVGWGLKL